MPKAWKVCRQKGRCRWECMEAMKPLEKVFAPVEGTQGERLEKRDSCWYWLPASHWGGWMISVLTTWTGRERKTSCWHEWLMEKSRMETLLGLNRWHAVLHGSCLPSCGISWIQSHARNQPSASYNRWMTYCSLTRNRQNKHISVAGPTSSS